MIVGRQPRTCIEAGPTALRAVAATMRAVYHQFDATHRIADAEVLTQELMLLERTCKRALPVRDVLMVDDISPRAFMALIINTLIRVLPTYAEIPINLAAHGLNADIQNYGLIALNVNDEAGRGVPEKTHPALFNRSATAFTSAFGLPPLNLRIGRAALTLRRREGEWTSTREALSLVEPIVRQDEYGRRLQLREMKACVKHATAYAPFIAAEAVECYLWRLRTLADLISGELREEPDRNARHVALLSMLAVREAAAADPEGIFGLLSAMIRRYGWYFDESAMHLCDALSWSDAHVDEALGEVAGYEGHSVEDDHAIQALGAVLDHLHDDSDLLTAVQAMNGINEQRIRLWEGTAKVMAAQSDEKLPARVASDHPDRQCGDDASES
jgi:hypothetical protein